MFSALDIDKTLYRNNFLGILQSIIIFVIHLENWFCGFITFLSPIPLKEAILWKSNIEHIFSEHMSVGLSVCIFSLLTPTKPCYSKHGH